MEQEMRKYTIADVVKDIKNVWMSLNDKLCKRLKSEMIAVFFF